MRTRGLIALVCVVGVLAGACTSQAAAPPTSTSTSTNASSASSTSSSVRSSSSSMPSTSSTPGTSSLTSKTPTSSSPAPTTKSSAAASNPWPANLKPAQVKDAQAAITTYRTYYDTINAAYADPEKNWDKPITALTAEPVRSQQLNALAQTRSKGQKLTGSATVDSRVVKVAGDVYLQACVDTSKTVASAGGKILKKLPDVKGSYWRHLQLATVTKYADGTWRISAVDEQNWSTKC